MNATFCNVAIANQQLCHENMILLIDHGHCSDVVIVCNMQEAQAMAVVIADDVVCVAATNVDQNHKV